MVESSSVRNRKPPGVRREQILTVATEAFGNSGFRGVSLADIAATVGISQPGLLHHFRSKEELLIAALERRDEDSFSHMAIVFNGASTVDGLLALCRHNQENPESMRLYAVTAAESIEPAHPAHGYFRQRYVRVRSSVAGHIRRDQDAGLLLPELDPDETAAEIIAVMDGLQVQWLLDPSVDMCAVMETYLRRLTRRESADGEVVR
ncbi:TetR/AcrR family transcriptional regulator [Phytoactinopolyspora halotolerans]|uniref:TetR/AcrR family transcriptional regulator n=1 Tax=Phytoactinopolyspora halotolerans TaxID=1981512 RepID=A0A6L9SCW2_9ACTN|nr:TetR/AcrR family transcriptional regulator [Phytoactinopolyspora halotolerans]NEE03235.1 TetR/AcrR family transcriptional regulator [Phytoactinopolyspora halotolerans]